MQTEAARLETEVRDRLARAARVDATEDAQHGLDRRGDELPAELGRRTTRLQTIRSAMAALEAEAKAAAPPPPEGPRRGRPPQPPPGTVPPKAQRNFTDPDSRIMVDGDKAFVQAYNAQAAMEAHHVIVACTVTNQASDAPHLLPLVEAVRKNTRRRPTRVLADAGYWSEANVTGLKAKQLEPLIAPGKVKHGPAPAPPRGRIPKGLSVRDRMRRTLATKRGHALYARRKVLTEPVFGLIKRARNFRQFLLRGLAKVQGEWALICTGQNLLTLFRSGRWATA
jgi:hypothetical protein